MQDCTQPNLLADFSQKRNRRPNRKLQGKSDLLKNIDYGKEDLQTDDREIMGG